MIEEGKVSVFETGNIADCYSLLIKRAESIIKYIFMTRDCIKINFVIKRSVFHCARSRKNMKIKMTRRKRDKIVENIVIWSGERQRFLEAYHIAQRSTE